MNATHLTGLEGTNPLGFLAALGVQVAFADEPEQPRLWWTDDVTPHAIVDGDFTAERIADRAMAVFGGWKDSAAVVPRGREGPPLTKGKNEKDGARRDSGLKFANDDIRTYLETAQRGGSTGPLASALVAEGSLDNNGVAKPSDLYFTAGQQQFLDIARQVLGDVSRADVIDGLQAPWSYRSELPSMGWDVTDDRVYALRSSNPSPEKKTTNPGPEALALLGISLHPVFGSRDRTLTQGCSESWKTGAYSWPLWGTPASPRAVKSLLAQARDTADGRGDWLRSWGVSSLLRSPVRRSDQGGYGTFGPPEVVWRAT